MKVAALDLGSNTFLCLICEIENKKITDIYSDDVEIVRLGQDLSKTKRFHPDALARAKNCLSKFKLIINQHRPDRILAMATSAARDAENKNELFQICKDLDIPLEIITGSKEADITYRGSVSAQVLKQTSNQNRLVVDIGGGSTEFISGSGDQILHSQSFDIGCVRLTEKYILNQPTIDPEIQNCQAVIREKIQTLPNHSIAEILAVAGTPTTLAAVELGGFDAKKIDGYEMTLKNLEQWLQKLQPLSVDQKIELGFPKGRADVIIVGIIILIETLKKFNLNKIIVSTRGVRYGVALELSDRI